MTLKSPRIAQQAFDRGYEAQKRGDPVSSNPYKPTKSIDSRWVYWNLGWNYALEGKQRPEIDYEFLIS